jgi:parvulin-like peptidyl-prolyl isomerase
VNVTPREIERMHDLTYGPKRQVRLITAPNLAEVKEVVERVEAGEAFGDVAVELSTDLSAARGGLLEPVSREDQSYPRALRDAIWALDEPGAHSAPILMNNGYAIVQLVREIEGDDTPVEDVREEMQRLVRLRQERLLMDQLARAVLDDVSVTIFDDSLRWSWRNTRRRSGE